LWLKPDTKKDCGEEENEIIGYEQNISLEELHIILKKSK
jgi:hypothetical protein